MTVAVSAAPAAAHHRKPTLKHARVMAWHRHRQVNYWKVQVRRAHTRHRRVYAVAHERHRLRGWHYWREWVRRLSPRPRGGTPTRNRAIGRRMAAARGWTGARWRCLRSLWQGESGWRSQARNGGSGAFGIPQALPASKLRSAGRNIRSAAVQIRWGLRYIAGRYGNPCRALARWRARSPHWY